jgi:arylsulfatase
VSADGITAEPRGDIAHAPPARGEEETKRSTIVTFVVLAVAVAATSAWAQKVNGVLGLPDATISIDGRQLPPPDMKWGGVIKEDALQSKPWWTPR